MSTTQLKKLSFQVSVDDFASKTLNSINKSIHRMHQNMATGADRVRSGAVGLMASGAGLYSFLQPVYDMQNALGEVRSLGVAEKEINSLKDTASDFSVTFGESAVDFVRSSYDIQSAIAGLASGELAKFTYASNVLAKGTKANAATVTSYMGTMYGIFSEQAQAMGKAQWVEQLTGQTATAVQMFKTTGAEMSAAFTSLGANAEAAGIGLSEQMAILGTLQATMSGSEAGTKYKAFLSGVGAAQAKLGLSFTDAQGKMLPMLEILDKVKGKFGSTLDVAESDALKKAFGSDEAVGLVKLLMNQTHGLHNSIQKLGDVRGMEQAERMASEMVDPWARLGAVTTDLRISFGELLLPTINSVLSAMNSGLGTIKGWVDEYPNLARWVAYGAITLLGFAAATSLCSIAMGVGTIAVGGLGLAMTLLTSKFMLITGAIAAVGTAGYLLYTHWDSIKNSFMELSWAQALCRAFEKVSAWFSNLYDKALQFFDSLSFFDDDISVKMQAVESKHQNVTAERALLPTSLNADSLAMSEPSRVTPFRLPDMATQEGQQLQNRFFNSSKKTQFGDVNIFADHAPTPEDLAEWGLLQGG